MKTVGILASYREKFLLLKEKVLKDEEFVLYDFCVHQADFDEKHFGKFGTFQQTNKELAEGLGWSEDKVCRNIKTLFEKGFLRKIDRKTEVVDFFRFIPRIAFKRTKQKEEIAYLQEKIAKVRSQVANLHEESAKLHNSAPDLATNNTSISDISSYKVSPFIPRSYEDYKRIKEEYGFTMLTEEDMKWIDENITEDKNIQC